MAEPRSGKAGTVLLERGNPSSAAMEMARRRDKRRDRKEGRRRAGQPRSRLAVWGLAPFTFFALFFAVYPMFQVVRMALSDVSLQSGGFVFQWTGFENVSATLVHPLTWKILGNTVMFVVVTVVLTLIAGFILAVIVDRAVMLLPLAQNMLIWPAIIAPVVISLIWLLILSPTAGGLNKLLNTMGLPQQGWLNTETGAFASVVAVDVWHWTPVVFLFLYTALKAIDSATIEAARVDGAGEIRILRHVVIPQLLPAIAAVTIVRIIMGVKAFDEMYLMTRGGPNYATSLVSHRVKDLFFDNLQLGPGAAFSMIVVVMVALGLGIFLFIRSRKEESR